MNEGVHVGGGTGPTLPGGGWNLVALTDFNRDGYPDYLLYNADTHRTVVWYMRDNVHFASKVVPLFLPAGMWLGLLISTETANQIMCCSGHYGPIRDLVLVWAHSHEQQSGTYDSGGYDLAGVADFNRDAKPDYLLWDSTHSRTAMWYINDNVRIATAIGPTLHSGYRSVAALARRRLAVDDRRIRVNRLGDD